MIVVSSEAEVGEVNSWKWKICAYDRKTMFGKDEIKFHFTGTTMNIERKERRYYE